MSELEPLLDVERRLKAALNQRRPYNDPELAMLRSQYCDLAVRAIDRYPVRAAQHSVERELWKLVFYKQIKQFREAKMANKSSRYKFLKIYKRKLNEFSAFYQRLLEQHRSRIGDERPLSLATAHRCLIYLGDLVEERYIQQTEEDQKARNWTQSAEYYKEALRLIPTNGNPHNQLAVLATYSNHIVKALYYYLRSVNVTTAPFESAYDNIKLLLQKNRDVLSDRLNLDVDGLIIDQVPTNLLKVCETTLDWSLLRALIVLLFDLISQADRELLFSTIMLNLIQKQFGEMTLKICGERTLTVSLDRERLEDFGLHILVSWLCIPALYTEERYPIISWIDKYMIVMIKCCLESFKVAEMHYSDGDRRYLRVIHLGCIGTYIDWLRSYDWAVSCCSEEFWQVLAKITNHLGLVCEVFKDYRLRSNSVLPEEQEMNGFKYLNGMYLLDDGGDCSEKDASIEWLVKRAYKVRNFTHFVTNTKPHVLRYDPVQQLFSTSEEKSDEIGVVLQRPITCQPIGPPKPITNQTLNAETSSWKPFGNSGTPSFGLPSNGAIWPPPAKSTAVGQRLRSSPSQSLFSFDSFNNGSRDRLFLSSPVTTGSSIWTPRQDENAMFTESRKIIHHRCLENDNHFLKGDP